MSQTEIDCHFPKNQNPGGGGGGGALGYLGGHIRSLSKLKNTPKALISGQKSNLILIKTLIFFHLKPSHFGSHSASEPRIFLGL